MKRDVTTGSFFTRNYGNETWNVEKRVFGRRVNDLQV